MAHPTLSGKLRRAGFSLVELLIVMAIISILIGVAVPFYQRSVQRTKESILRQNLFTLRQVIDEYTYDKAKAPQALDDLVREGYLRQVPVDPMTGESDWFTINEDALTQINQSEPGIYDVRSKSDKRSLEGTPYNEW